MAWTWRYEGPDGSAMEWAGQAGGGPDESFASQADAESWLGQTWRQLAESGVTTVVLVEGDRVEYRMSLLPATE